ncbi:retrovirus-related Pol polyprotein from transposon 412 [Trichonephila clavipes]|nr:retrovirus-related Pol polyprotein from transposon 412 [Trichonephila clavipes]
MQQSFIGLFWDSFHLRNGVLYRKCESHNEKTFRWQLILPKTRISTVLKELHGSPTGGNFGVMKTLQTVRERFYWNNVRSDVEKSCRIRDPCAACKGHMKRTRGRLQLYNEGAFFERIAFDILDRQMVTITSWLSWITLLSGLKPILFLTKRPQLLQSNQHDWDMKLALFLLAYMSAVHETTDYSPSQMLFGRDLRLPADLLFRRPPDASLAPEEYIEKLFLSRDGRRKCII